MIRFSANLGFLWTERTLPEAIRAAREAGFDAVECHWPYEVPEGDVKAALRETGLPMLGLNTRRGDLSNGDNGLAAVPGREAEARGLINEALAYAGEIGCANVHVMAGFTDGGAKAEATFCENLAYAADRAEADGTTILIEPLNRYDAPGYHLSNLDHALAILATVGRPNLKIMFDCYHLQIMQGDLLRRLESSLDHIGHIQIAAVPDRGEPDAGEVNYPWLLQAIDGLGWAGYFGAEYKPRTTTQEGLGWLKQF